MQECLAKDIRYRQGTWLKSRPLLHNTASYLLKNSFNLYVYIFKTEQIMTHREQIEVWFNQNKKQSSADQNYGKIYAIDLTYTH
jgi:hypothetical protein